MMNNIKIFKFILLTCAFATVADANAGLLIQSYERAKLSDYEYQVAIADYNANREQRAIDRSGILPTLGVEAQRLELVDAGTESNSYSVFLQQSLFDLSSWYTYKQGKALSERAEIELEQAKQAMILRLVQAYLGALEANDNYRIALAEEKAFIDQLARSKKRHDLGLAAIAEVYEAESVADSAKADTLTARAAIGVSFSQLALLTGESYDSLAHLKDDFPIAMPAPSGEEEWVELGLKESLEIQAAQLTLTAATANSRSRKASHLPTIVGRVSHDYSDTNGLSSSFQTIGEDEDTQILLTLEIPLFSGGGIAAARRQAAHQKTSAEKRYFLAEQNTVRLVRSSHLTLIASVASVEARKKIIDSTDKALKSSEAGFKIGTRNLVDLLNARRSVFQAERNYRAALYDYILNSLTLKLNAGVLSESDLIYLDQWLSISPTLKES